jgi:hypothetical protein
VAAADPDSERVLVCSIRGEWSEAETVQFGSMLNRAFAESRDGQQVVELQAVFAPSAYRLDATIQRKETHEISVISRADGELIWLDHHRRLFATVGRKQLPPKRIKSSMRVVSAPARESDGEQTVVRTTIRDAHTHSEWQHHLVCDPSHQVSASVLRAVLTVLLGDPDLQRRAGFPWNAVNRLVGVSGLPVAGGMTLAADPRRGTAFKLEGIEYEAVDDDRFGIPPDYGLASDFESADRPRPRRLRRNVRLNGDGPVRIEYREPGTPPTFGGGPTVPQTPPPAGQAAVIGLWIPQSALDAIRTTFNQLVRPLTGFSVARGFVTFDWLGQLRADWLDKNGGGGTATYCALHDEPLPAAGAATPSRCATFTGKGQLDALALKSAEAMVGSGTLPAAVVSGLPAAVSTELSNAGGSWAALNAGAQSRIACEVLWEVLGKFQLPLNPDPNAASPTDPIVIETDLATISISQITGTLELPAVQRSMKGTVTIESRPVIQQLYCRADAYVVAEVHLGTVHLDGLCAVTPTAEYWAGVAIAQVAAVLFPPLAALSAHAAAVGLELLADGSNSVTFDLVDATFFAYVTLRQDAQGLWGPVLTFSASGDLAVRFAPLSVTSLAGVFEILQEALRGWYTGLAFAALADELGKKVYERLKGIFGAGFPNAVTKVGIPIVGGTAIGAAMDHVYFEVQLGTIPNGPPRSPIPVNPHQALQTDLAALKAGPNAMRELRGVHCLSLNLSENAVNEILAGRLTGLDPPFVGTVQPQDLALLASVAQPPAQSSQFGFAWLEAAMTPMITLLSTAGQYARLDVTLGLTALAQDPISAGSGVIPGATWRFRVSAPAQVVIGSARPQPGSPLTPIVDFREFPEHVCDVLLDLNAATITLLGMTLMSPAAPMQQVQVTPAVAAQQEQLLRAALQSLCGPYGFTREPRRDGMGGPPTGGGPTDKPREQTYTVDATDPDAGGGSPPIEFPVALGLSPGLLHMHAQLFGLLSALLDGTISAGAGTSDCALGRSFQKP